MVIKVEHKSICFLSSVPITLWSFYRGLIRQLISTGFEVIVISSDLPDLHKLKKELHCDIYVTNVTRKISPLKDGLSICRLWWFFRKCRCRIVHAHTPKGGLIGMVSSWLACVPNRVYTIHGLVSETAKGPKKKLLWSCEWLCCKLATQVLAVSPSLRQLVIDEGICPGRKIRVLGHGSACGIDLEKFRPTESLDRLRTDVRNQYNIPDSATVIGYLGRITPDKGIRTLVLAFEKLQSKKSGLYLLLVGDIESVRDMLDDETERKIKTNPRILCNGIFEYDVLPFYAAMDIFVLPSRREGFGLTIIEASALKLPVIATKVTGCIDAVVNGETGLLVEVDNVEQLAEAIWRLAEDPQLCDKLGWNGCRRAHLLFDSRTLIIEHIDLYERLMTSCPCS